LWSRLTVARASRTVAVACFTVAPARPCDDRAFTAAIPAAMTDAAPRSRGAPINSRRSTDLDRVASGVVVGWRRGGGGEPVGLSSHQRRVVVVAAHELRVRADFRDGAVPEDDDAVGRGDGGQAVSDDEGRAAFAQPGDGLLHFFLALRVEGGGRFVQD